MNADYFQIHINVRIKNRWVLGDHESSDPEDRRRIYEGEPVRGRITIDPSDYGMALGFSLTAFGLAVAKDEVAEKIKAVADGDVQIVPAHIEGHSGFSIVHCLRTIECVDESRSVFDKYPDDDPYPDRRGGYRGFAKLIVDTNRIPADAHFFHAAGWQIKLIVSKPVRDIVKKVENASVNCESVTKG
ncbi:MAG: hypothetical protein H7Y89_20550 [Steroidobacteraceae bacterium]|nr:hypothetical protein [Steroidobacteraceae bacterium]